VVKSDIQENNGDSNEKDDEEDEFMNFLNLCSKSKDEEDECSTCHVVTIDFSEINFGYILFFLKQYLFFYTHIEYAL
jgi:hypothetical protein